MQETKVIDADFPRAELEKLGYQVAINGQKSYNGVCILSKYPLSNITKGFDDAVVGMTIGDKKTINIPAHEAYGERNEQMVIDFPRSNFPEDMAPEAGMQLMMNNSEGQQFPVTIIEVGEEVVVLDANHMLAGKELVFDIEMLEIDAKGLIIMP